MLALVTARGYLIIFDRILAACGFAICAYSRYQCPPENSSERSIFAFLSWVFIMAVILI